MSDAEAWDRGYSVGYSAGSTEATELKAARTETERFRSKFKDEWRSNMTMRHELERSRAELAALRARVGTLADEPDGEWEWRNQGRSGITKGVSVQRLRAAIAGDS